MPSRTRPVRADALRNRGRILDAARAQIAGHGPEVGMDAIAAAAGVAVGTLYRHYPTKADLVAAVLAEYTERLTASVEGALHRARQGEPPLVMIMEFLAEAIRVSAANGAAKAAAPSLGVATDLGQDRAAAAMSQLIALGIEAGDVRADLTTADVYLLVAAAPLDQPAAVRERWTALVLPCITAAAAAIEIDG